MKTLTTLLDVLRLTVVIWRAIKKGLAAAEIAAAIESANDTKNTSELERRANS